MDALAVGAEMVGLAGARALAQAGLEVVITELEARLGSGVSIPSAEANFSAQQRLALNAATWVGASASDG